MNDDIARPITLYVSRFEFDHINLDYLERKRISVIDVEMSYQEMVKLSEFLQNRLNEKTPGAVRVRIYGSLVIS